MTNARKTQKGQGKQISDMSDSDLKARSQELTTKLKRLAAN
jgi:hypothetical protein